MSNSVYPSLPGLAFPVGRAVLPPPVQVRTTPSQREYRARDAFVPRYQYSLAYEFLRTGNRGTELATLLGFYNQAGGPFDSWLFLDPDDNSVTANTFGVGNGTTTGFQLLRSFGGFAEPVYDPLGVPLVMANGAAANLITNGGFEVDSDSDGMSDNWGFYTTGSTGTLSKGRPNGPLYAGPTGKYQNVVASALNGRVGLNQTLQVTAGALMSLSCDVSMTSGVTFYLSINWLSAVGAFMSDVTVSSGSASGRHSISGVAPAGAYYAACYIFIESASGTNCSLNVDEVQLNAGAGTVFSAATFTVGSTGIITFASAPAAAAALTWSGQFYRRCRFLGDSLDTSKFLQDLFEAKAVKFISVKP